MTESHSVPKRMARSAVAEHIKASDIYRHNGLFQSSDIFYKKQIILECTTLRV